VVDLAIWSSGTATRSCRFGAVDELTPEELPAHLDVNLFGPVNVTQAVVKASNRSPTRHHNIHE
jgi:NAD(P)-dependent dehydrogenase (short-subunit alcohol dehydrogenase family)